MPEKCIQKCINDTYAQIDDAAARKTDDVTSGFLFYFFIYVTSEHLKTFLQIPLLHLNTNTIAFQLHQFSLKI